MVDIFDLLSCALTRLCGGESGSFDFTARNRVATSSHVQVSVLGWEAHMIARCKRRKPNSSHAPRLKVTETVPLARLAEYIFVSSVKNTSCVTCDGIFGWRRRLFKQHNIKLFAQALFIACPLLATLAFSPCSSTCSRSAASRSVRCAARARANAPGCSAGAAPAGSGASGATPAAGSAAAPAAAASAGSAAGLWAATCAGRLRWALATEASTVRTARATGTFLPVAARVSLSTPATSKAASSTSVAGGFGARQGPSGLPRRPGWEHQGATSSGVQKWLVPSKTGQ